MDGELIAEARRLRPGSNDATLLDEALRSLAASNRAREIDADYAAYDLIPPDEPDEWGSLSSFREAAGSS
ncbi:MAG: antitoxin MazE5 [Acidimicrobiales bacterium]